MPEAMTKEEGLELTKLVKQMQSKVEEHGFDSPEAKKYIEKMDSDLKGLDEKNEKMTAELADTKKREDELKDRLGALETMAANITSGPGVKADTGDVNQFVNALLKNTWMEYAEHNGAKATAILEDMKSGFNLSNIEGAKMASVMQQKAASDLLRSDIGELGGFLCPPEYASELERNMIEYSPIRRYARVKRTTSKVYKQPVRVGIPVATRPGEAREGGKSVPNYNLQDWTPMRLTNTVPVTHDELAFNAYDLASELIKDSGEAFAVKEGQEFVNGTGVNEGVGFETDANVPERDTATSTLTFDDIINVTGDLKQGYNPMYLFNRRTLAYLRTLKDGSNRYLWAGPFGDAATGSPATINGYPYSAAFIDMDDYDTDAGFPVLFGDIGRFYLIVDRTDITIIRDEYTRKVEGIVEFTMNKWCFGKPLLQEAAIRLKKIA